MTRKQWDAPRSACTYVLPLSLSHVPIAIVEHERLELTACLDARTIISPMPTSSVRDLAFYLSPLLSFVSWGHTHSSMSVSTCTWKCA
ncbi:hypothetical protein PISMIDRAFT_466834 [Pisolithus microcarpus 441]|uniref:Uncharacterized protein n=1 Tax=Pisolithus microcarpus 441 TaxID=765257 RepID=A0A0C9Z5X3_9AGAM|nr:hypothetical protein PISMIDRAFT_322638 [Pisolithus microcarpus 441]KIK23290.1 hypothetical protein PISMIDRAFT_466834 [Pisolithus microcarpus 441]